MTRTERHAALPRAYRVIAAILRPILRGTGKRDWHGVENIPPSGGFVAAPNHLSYWDPLTFALFMYDNGAPPFFLAKEGLFSNGFVRKILLSAGQIPVSRNTGAAAGAFTAAVEAVEAGRAVAIFPDGTLTRDPDLWPMRGKTGAARVALITRCPLVPIAQWGAQEVLPPYGKVPKIFPRKTMHLAAGPAIDLSDLYDRPTDSAVLREATDRLMSAITSLLEGLRDEVAPTERFDPRKAGLSETGKPQRRPAQPGDE